MKNNIQEGLHFLKYGLLSWEVASPPRALKIKDRWTSIICDIETKKAVESKAEWQIEKFCIQRKDEFLNRYKLEENL